MELSECGVGDARRGGGGELGYGGRTGVDGFAECVELFKGNIPLSSENVRRELSPMGGHSEVGVSGEDTEVIEVVGGAAVVSV